MKTRTNLIDTLATCNTIVDMARHDRARAGFDTLESSRVALERAIAKRNEALEALEAFDAV